MNKKDKGARWPEKTIKACQKELADGKSVKELEQIYGVPAGTLYRWKRTHNRTCATETAERTPPDRRMAESAERGAMAAVKLMERRITRSAAAERKRERLLAELEKTPEGEGRRLLEKRLKELEEPISASSLTTMYKALSEKSASENGNAPLRVEVVLNKDGEEYAG